jgi:hypothetical protein
MNWDLTLEVTVRHQLIHLCPKLTEVSLQVSLLGYAPIPVQKVAMLIT